LTIQCEGGSFALHPTKIGAVETQPVAHHALGQSARDNLFGLKILLGPKGHDVPELVRLDFMPRSHGRCRLTSTLTERATAMLGQGAMLHAHPGTPPS